MSIMRIIYIVLWICYLHLYVNVQAWREWNYSVTWADDPNPIEVSSKISQWAPEWDQLLTIDSSSVYIDGVPRPRRGHSLVLVKSQVNSALKGHTYVVMFGGRDNDGKFRHTPKTYNVKTINGTLEFTTYDEKPVDPCEDPEGKYYSVEERKSCTNSTSALINIGVIYNDVWAYKLCPVNSSTETSTRYFNGPCEGSGWVLWHPGALQGGCTIELGIEVCTVPSERYNHASVAFDDGAIYIYGGYSQRCADYCDDIWFFDIYLRGWRQIYKTGALTKLYQELYSYSITPDPYTNYEVPRDNTSNQHAGPGKRWRHSMVISPAYNSSQGKYVQDFYLFGGHRIWQGFSQENSESNNWSNYTTIEQGGYLNDFWIYTKQLDFVTLPAEDFKESNGRWKYVHKMEQCFANPGIEWSTRNDVACVTVWPSARAGHGLAYDANRTRLWLFGGYSTYFPYVSTDGVGSSNGTTKLGSGGFIPYPDFGYFKNDLWYYSFNDSYWHQVSYPVDASVPDPRVDMVFLLTGDVLFMHGGFADSYFYDDTWFFNISAMKWIEKKKFMYPVYPSNCTDDEAFILANNCSELLWPKHLERGEGNDTDILPYSQQPYYTYNYMARPYYPILPHDHYRFNRSIIAQEGVPMFPYAATGPRQYAMRFIYPYNSSYNATLYDYCTSVFGEPTRGFTLDGLYGRASRSIFIAQPRRQRPGWDGCRDRAVPRYGLVNELQYQRPLPRASHRAIFHAENNEIIMYGGQGYLVEEPVNYSVTWTTEVKSDMWYFNLFHCMNNCSDHGDCSYGSCFCQQGYYGVDCSNISCPGTFCDYDPFTHEQQCLHACQAGYIHTDNDSYVQDVTKLPCSTFNPGESNGICDGWGTAQCAPPFIGDDCSIKDCLNNCSFHGWCSVEYPVSRCMCLPGYFGQSCEYRQCLNNCSYPNGNCNTSTGSCNCNMRYSPYNNTRPFKPWEGEDCSYLMGYAAASTFFGQSICFTLFGYSNIISTMTLTVLCLMIIVSFTLASDSI